MNLCDFVRIDTEGGCQQALELSVVSFAHEEGHAAKVDFVSCIHAGDEEFYKTLNERLAQYGTVFYELVATPEQIEKLKKSEAHLRDFYSASTKNTKGISLVELAGAIRQESIMSLAGKRYVHADLTQDELAEALKAKDGADVEKFLASSVVDHSDKEIRLALVKHLSAKWPSRATLAEAIMTNDLFTEVRRFYCSEILRRITITGLTEEQSELLMDARESRAMDAIMPYIRNVLNPPCAILFGAIHGPAFARKLFAQCGLTPISSNWFRAWNLADSHRASERQLQLAEKLYKQW